MGMVEHTNNQALKRQSSEDELEATSGSSVKACLKEAE